MAGLRLDSVLLAALLDRPDRPQKWAQGVAQQLAAHALLHAADPPPSFLDITEGIREAIKDWVTTQDIQGPEAAANRQIAQPMMDARRALEAVGLPEHIAAAALERLASPICGAAELQAAVQDPSVTRELLQHLRQAAEDGSGPAVDGWHGDAVKAAVCEAARLADLPLLEWFADAALHAALRHGEQQVQQQHATAPPLQQQSLRQTYVTQYRAELAAVAVQAAVASDSVAVLRLAATAPGAEAASPAQQLLQAAVIRCAADLAADGKVQLLQLLLAESGGQALRAHSGKLLRGALQSRQLDVFEQVLEKCGAPPNIEPLLAAAIEADQPAAVQLLIDRCGLPADPRRSLMAAIRKNQPAEVQLLLGGSSLVPGTAELVAAICLPSPPVVRALLAAGAGPAAVPPLAGVVDLFGPTNDAMRYTCPVLATLQERARTDRAAAGQLLVIIEALQAAGYRAATYDNVEVRHSQYRPPQLVEHFDPIAQDPRLNLQATNKFLWLAAERPDWSPAQHHRFVPRFKSWVRAFLLAVYRRRAEVAAGTSDSTSAGEGSEGSALLQHLAALPNDLLLRVVGQAAYPLSIWTPGAWAHAA